MTATSSRHSSAAKASRGEVRVISPAPRSVWQNVWRADPEAVATQAPEWLDAVCATGAYRDASRCYQLPGGRTLVLPLVARRWGGVRLTESSFPAGWGYGGLLGTSSPTPDELRLVLADLARRPMMRVSITPMPLLAADWTAAAGPGVLRTPHLTHVIDLRDGWDAVWKRYRPKVRQSVRRAQRSGLEVRCQHGEAAVPVFNELYGRTVEHWAKQRGRPGWIARLAARYEDTTGRLATAARRLGEACAIWTAHLDGAPVAANVTLNSPGHVVGWVSAMDRDLVQQTGASYLLESLAIEEACRSGARHFHMGESDPGTGVARHKAQLGAREVSYDSLKLERLPLSAAEQTTRAVVRAISDRGTKRASAQG